MTEEIRNAFEDYLIDKYGNGNSDWFRWVHGDQDHSYVYTQAEWEAWQAAWNRRATPGLHATEAGGASPDAAKLLSMWLDEWELILPPDARESFRNDLLPSVVASQDGGRS